MSTAVHPQQAKSLGRWQWGVQNRNTQTLWFSRSSSLATALKPLKAVVPAVPNPPIPHSSPTEPKYPTLPDNHTLDKMILDRVLTHGTSLQALCDFDPVQYIHRRAQGPSTPGELAVWSAFMTALAMPAGGEWLRSKGVRHLPHDEHQIRWLENLAKACCAVSRSMGRFPDIVWQSELPVQQTDLAVQAANLALSRLCGQPSQPASADWVVNALRNGLDPDKQSAQFQRIERRLLKLGTWLKRAEQSRRWARAWPMAGKHPFNNLQWGLLGADRGGSKPITELPSQPGRAFSRGGLLSTLNHLVDNIQGASRLRWYGGGRAGLALQGLSIRLIQCLTGLLIRVKIKLSLHGIRQAGFEMAMPPYNMELLLISRRGTLFRTGVGIGAGPGIEPLDIHGGVELEALQSEVNHMEGIALRMPRIRGQESTLRERFKALLADLVNRPGGLSEPGDFLKYLLANYPELSISELGNYREKTHSHSAQLEATASLKCVVFELCCNLFARLRWTRRSRRELVDNTGAIRVHKKSRLHGLECAVGAKLEVKSPMNHSDPSMRLTNGTPWSADWTVGSASRSFRQDWVESDGLVHPMSFIEVEYQHVHDFVSSIQAHKATWISERAQQKQCSHAQAEQELNTFLNDCRNNRASNLTYAARAELRPHCVTQINRAKALLDLLANHHPALSQTLQQGINTVQHSPDSYRPTSFRVYHRQSNQRRCGLQIGLQLECIDQADGVHAHNRLM
ncbi:hypothetical protein NQT62_00820 [Limnobacter humi]|uniref:Uncharacterized protein n=1 Tax=Limnobacter humi TaxID=1778671 RepID=A0ABT1WBT7_9BURK|nr:hypothetical protein [Limnobacter humi]MCQ8894979.1 hypothetical protein [Limnobacter humi]